MASIIKAIFGSNSDGDQQNTTTVEHSAVGGDCLQTSVVSDDVQVKSVISSKTQANASLDNKMNFNNLLAQLNTTHTQIDQYSRTRTAEINDQAQKSIAQVLEETRREQEALLADANTRHLAIDSEYQVALQRAVEKLDAVKAKALVDLERDLQEKQQLIMTAAKRKIDVFNDLANAAKLNVLAQVQEQAKENIDQLANQVGALGQQQAESILQATTTTVIKSQAQAATTTTDQQARDQGTVQSSTERSHGAQEKTTTVATVSATSDSTTKGNRH